MKAHGRYLRSIRWESSRALSLLLLTVCALFPTLVQAAPAEERPVEANPEQKQAPQPELEVEVMSKEEPLASRLTIEERSPGLSVKPIADSPTTKSLPTGENKTGVSSQSISVPKGPGTIEGMGESFSAQASTGIATFSVPFALPAARGDAQPSLALSYSSASGSGVAGVGWDVGVPFIARETDRGLPQYDDKSAWHANQDRFVYNGGQELVPISEPLEGEVLPTWAGAGWQYFRPRVEGSYLRFFWNPSLELWRVQDKGGVILELGVVGTEQDAIETDPTSSKVFRWNLKRQFDPHGNEVRYYYDRLEGNVRYLTDILYTQPPGVLSGIARSAWAYQVHLDYVDRTDVTRSYRRGWETIQDLRLSTVTVSAKDNDPIGTRRLVRTYRLS